MPFVATRSQFLDALRSEIGYTESPPGSNKTKFATEAGYANGQKWCSTFVTAVAKRVGLDVPGSFNTQVMANGFKSRKQWVTSGYQPGDIVFFQFDGDPETDHVGVVLSVNPDGSLVTVEGNTSSGDAGSQSNGGGVFRRTRKPSLVVGAGRPTYSTEDQVPEGQPRIIVKAGSPENALLVLYPDLLGRRSVRVVATPPPGQDIQAESNKDIGFGVYVKGSKRNYLGPNRVVTLISALRGEGVI